MVAGYGVCKECNGKGHYTIRNAYDPNYGEEVICEYCNGDGDPFIGGRVRGSVRKSKRRNEDEDTN